jgi:hypothetical protein
MTDLVRTRTHHEFLQMNPWLIGEAMKLLTSLQSAKIGGRDRDRTCDLMLAKHALSQLSYTPTVGVPFILKHFRRFQNPFVRFLVIWCEPQFLRQILVATLPRFVPACRRSSLLDYEAKEKQLRTASYYRAAFGSADRPHSVSLGHGRRRSGPLRPPLVPQPGRSARRAERLSSAGCCISAPNTSAAVRPRERSGARKHQTPWAC